MILPRTMDKQVFNESRRRGKTISGLTYRDEKSWMCLSIMKHLLVPRPVIGALFVGII